MTDRKAVIYTRVSTGEQNCENQLRDLKKYSDFRKWRIAGQFQDDAISGLKKKRPGLDEMMEQIRRGKYDILLVWSYDRFARSASHLVTTLDELKNLGVDFCSYQQQIDTTSSLGTMMFTLFAGIAQLERDLISERTKAALARLKDSGTVLGRPKTYDDDLVDRVKRLRANGLSMRQIANTINKSAAWVHGALKRAH